MSLGLGARQPAQDTRDPAAAPADAAPAPYRGDIDVLRAVAVVGVLLYHAFPALLTGGFAGVDIFFVISGYLITGHILRDHAAGVFEFAAFYGRRIRRIFPALVLVLASALIGGWWLLSSFEYRQLAKHVLGAVGFMSNLVLFSESGYFDEAAHTKPLLHLWSLAIEEQFYLLWPLVLVVALRWRARATWVVSLAALVAFGCCVRAYGLDPAGAFYLPIPRAWELLAGAWLAAAEASTGYGSSWVARLSARKGVGAIGWLAIAGGLILIDDRFDFPVPWALVPVLGTMLVLARAQSATSRVLADRRWILQLGLVSYPLYLWHWPLLTFARIVDGAVPPLAVRVVLVAASLALAWATWRFVERRSRQPARRQATAWAWSTALVGAGLLAGAVVLRDGFPGRDFMAPLEARLAQTSAQAQAAAMLPYRRCAAADPAIQALNFCHVSTAQEPVFALLGDSHAKRVFVGAAAEDPADSWLLLAHSSSPPLLDVDVQERGRGEGRLARSRAEVDYLRRLPSVKVVVLAFFGNAYLSDEAFAADHKLLTAPGPADVRLKVDGMPGLSRHAAMREGLDRTVRALQQAGKQVVVLVDSPELPFLPRDCVDRLGLPGILARRCELTRRADDARRAELVELTREVIRDNPGARSLDLAESLCDPVRCNFETPAGLLYEDSHHLTEAGGRVVARPLVALVRSMRDSAGAGAPAIDGGIRAGQTAPPRPVRAAR